jgi:pyruvate/2-oxoglutarate dehydrogenase complex dihydrolipoamide acyltransferase (E2) component
MLSHYSGNPWMRGLVQDVTIPALGMAMTGAVLTRWYKEPGETVAAGEAIAEIETDKSAVDLESPADGVLGPHLVAEGDEVPIGAAVTRVLDGSGQDEAVPLPRGEALVPYDPDPFPVPAVGQARSRALAGQGPFFIEAQTYRYEGHNVGDVQNYREKSEEAAWFESRDPIDRLRQRLAGQGELDDGGFAAATPRPRPGRPSLHPVITDARIPATRSGSASGRRKPAATPLRTTKEVTAMTAAHRPRPGSARSGPRRVIHALRYVDNELTRAFEVIIRSARAPQPRPRVQATAADSRSTAAERAGQAA